MRIIFWLLAPVLKLIGSTALILYLLSRWLGDHHDRVPDPPKGVKWLPCDRGSGEKSSKIIGRGGDTIELNGHVLDVPPEAVERDTRFTIHELPTPNVTLTVTAAGPLKGTVNLTLSYARCLSRTPDTELIVWRYRKQDGWQDRGGKDDPRTRTITVTNTKISRFTIAEGRH